MPAFASIASTILGAATGGLASLDQCADEYLLLLAERETIASVSHLAASAADNALSGRAVGLSANGGTIESLLSTGAQTVFTTRPLGRLDQRLARKLGIEIIMLETGDPAAVAHSVDRVARLANTEHRATAWLRRLERLQSRPPARSTRALWVGPGGVGIQGGPIARWLAFAGIEPVAVRPGLSRVEQVVMSDAPVLLRSRYDKGNFSLAGAYLDHPLVTRAGRRTLEVDGRRFTCAGPLILHEIARLKRELAR